MPAARNRREWMLGTFWTSEDPPRPVNIKGRSAMFDGCLSAECAGKTVLIYHPTGYAPEIGRNVFVAETPEAARRIRASFTPWEK